MITRLLSQAAALGVAAAFAMAAPAAAATTPTLSGPAQRTGYGTITLTGTADPGAAVQLLESAIGFNDLKPAENFNDGVSANGATADSTGKFSIVRYVDSGFYFAVESGGVRSERITVLMKLQPTFWVTSSAAGKLEAHTTLSPNADGITVHVQRQSGSAWTTARTGKTNSVGAFVASFTGLARGQHTYRAVVEADAPNGVLGNTSSAHSTFVAGPGGSTPATPAIGSVQFTRIQYNSPGTDSGSNASLNGEWVKLTNKTKAQINLNGWTVRDASSHVYKFSGNIYLKAGASTHVLTGKGTNKATQRYWGRTGKSGYIWNNAGDTATLRTGANKTIDSCKWTSGNGVTTC